MENVLGKAFSQFDLYAENDNDFQNFEEKVDGKRYYDIKLL